MRVPSCVIVVAFLVWGGCAETPAEPGRAQPSAAATCARGPSDADFDAMRAQWELVLPPAGDAANRNQTDAIVDLCDSIVTLAHAAGPGGGKTVPVGPSLLFRTSDAAKWTWSSIDVDAAVFRDVTRGSDVWVAVGGAGIGGPGVIAVANRPDSDAWRRVFSDDETAFRSVAFGAGTFVAVSTFGIAISRDGAHWSWASLPELGPVQFMDVAFGNGRFIVAGVGATLTSGDGKAWEPTTCGDAKACDALQQVTFVNDRFYLFGGSGGLESRDGRTLARVAVTLPAAAVGGVLVSAALDPETAWVRAGQADQLSTIFVSENHGQTWSSKPVTRALSADCTVDACVVIPAGVLVARTM